MGTTSRKLLTGLLVFVLGTAAQADDFGTSLDEPSSGLQPESGRMRFAQAPARPSAPTPAQPARTGRPANAPPSAAGTAPPVPSAATPVPAAPTTPPAQPPTQPSTTAGGLAAVEAAQPFSTGLPPDLTAGGLTSLANLSDGGIPQMIGDPPAFTMNGILQAAAAPLGPTGTGTPPPTQPPPPGQQQPPTPQPPTNHQPPPNRRPQNRPVFRISAPSIALKIAENQSPFPLDRVYGGFNYYGNVNRTYNQRVSPQFGNVLAYFQLYGFEKTFNEGHGSFGIRQSVQSVNVDSRGPAVPGGMFSAFGNLDVFAKYIVVHDDSFNRILSGGLDLSLPVGPAAFGGYPSAVGFRDTHIQPFIGYLMRQDRFFLQGFSSISAATDPNDVTYFFNDIAIGYYAYNSPDRSTLLTSIVPTFETHVNSPLNHSGFRANDPASQPQNVNLTFGTTFILKQRLYFTMSYTTPVTGPQPFGGEFTLQINYRFGRAFGNQPIQSLIPPATF